MWRHDPGRTATVETPDLPETPVLLWERRLPALQPAFRDGRLQFDRGYEPIVLGKALIVGSSFDDSVHAFHVDSGEALWSFRTGAPVRCAPVAGNGRVLFGSDDGMIYCLRAATGELLWSIRAVPSARTVLGNGRLISVWPVRGGPVLDADRVYFAAGVWPLEGVFVFCLDAATGAAIWRNDACSFLYGKHPHDADALGGLVPQGYLVLDGGDLAVPNGAAYPARFDAATGQLKDYRLPVAGRLPGGWFAATLPPKQQRLGLVFDSGVNAKRHEDKPRAEGMPGIRDKVMAGGREFRFADGYPGVSGEIHSMLTADGKLFVVTLEGSIYAFGAGSGSSRRFALPEQVRTPGSPRSRQLLAAAGARHGFAVTAGPVAADFLAGLVAGSDLHVVAIDSGLRPAQVAGFPASRLSFLPGEVELPPYFASLIAVETVSDAARLRRLYESLRPYGGTLAGPPGLFQAAQAAGLAGARVQAADGFTLVVRPGPLPGAVNYAGGWVESPDERVRAPLGLLWFGDTVSHFKRAPQPKFVDGVMISADKDWLDASTRKGKVDYRLLGPVFSDVYTGRRFEPGEEPAVRRAYAALDRETIQPAQYRPPTQRDDWKPDPPVAGTRSNPLTGEPEPRVFPRSYGCDGGFDYGHLYTLRSGTAAFYDKRLESGTVHVSGPRSGCTNSIVPANGLLNLPYFFEGCTCSYPLPSAAALVAMPETFEQWSCWGTVPAASLAGRIQRLGLNFGAPGDRMTREGTLWVGYPNAGRPAPEVGVTTDPAAPEVFYRHSLWLKNPGSAWPWVAGSGMRGLRSLRVDGFLAGRYSVRLVFSGRENRPGIPVAAEIDGVPGRRQLEFPADGPEAVVCTVEDVPLQGAFTARFEPAAALCGLEILRRSDLAK